MGLFDRVNQYGTDPMSRGAANMQSLTVPQMSPSYHTPPSDEVDDANPESHPATGGNPLTFVFLLLGLIVALFFIRKSSSVLASESFGINWLTLTQTTVMASFGILLLKAFFGRFHV